MVQGSVAEEALAQATKALQLKNLGILKASIDVDPDTVLGVDGNDLEVLLKWGTSKSQHVHAQDEVNNQAAQLFIVEVSTSLRMIDKVASEPEKVSLSDEATTTPAAAERKVRAEVEATYIVTYEIDQTKELGSTSLEEFAKRNVIYHVWPYWRAYITDTLGRANLPPFVLPMFLLAAQNKPHDSGLQSSPK